MIAVMTDPNPEPESEFEIAVTAALARVQAELRRQIKLEAAGRFGDAHACTHPSNSDADNFAIAIEESLEVTRAMQLKPFDPEHLEEEIVQAAATFVGWIVARSRRDSDIVYLPDRIRRHPFKRLLSKIRKNF